MLSLVRVLREQYPSLATRLVDVSTLIVLAELRLVYEVVPDVLCNTYIRGMALRLKTIYPFGKSEPIE